MQVSVQLLGSCQIVSDGRTTPLSAGRESSLFAFLALQPNTPVSRETLIDALWPDAVTLDYRKFRQTVWKLRRMLAPVGPALAIETTSAGVVVLRCDPKIIDAVRFADLVITNGNNEVSLRTAVDLYAGDFLAGRTDEWVERPRHEFQVRFLEAAKQLANILLARGAVEEALAYARRAVNTDPSDEDAALTFMRAAAECGELAAALTQHDIFTRALQDDDGPPPSPSLRALANELRTRRNILARGHSKSSGTGGPAGPLSDPLPLIDRTDETARLTQLLNQVRSGRSGAIVISGPAGIGKTRLVDSAVAEAKLRGLAVYKGACADVPNPPLWQPVVEALREPLAAGIARGQSPILTVLQPGYSDVRRRRGSGGVFPLSPIHSSLVTEALLALLPPIHGSPALLVLENVQRADEATRVWLDTLLRRLAEFQVCLMLTVRTGESGDAEDQLTRFANSGCEVVQLTPLTGGGVRRLIGAALATTDPPHVLFDSMWRHLGGNPLIILRAITVLQTQGLVKPSNSGWVVDPRAPEALAELASTHITAMVQQQLRLVPNGARDILSTAAVMGGDVAAEHLQRLAALPHRRFLAELDTLLYQGLLVGAEHGILHFAHEEIRNAVLEGLTPPRRHTLHARVADLLSSLGETARPEYMFWHYDAADDFSGACAAATAAGDRCYALGEHLAAIKWFERASDAFSRVPQPADVRQQLEIDLKLEQALNQHGSRQRQLDILDRVATSASDLGHHHELCEALIRRSLCLTRMNRSNDAIQAAERALVIAQRWSDLYHQARAYRALGLAYESSDDHAMVRHLTNAIRLFRRASAASDESVALSELTVAFDRLGNLSGAAKAINRAIAILPDNDPSRPALMARQGVLLMWRGRLSESLKSLLEALRLTQKAGQRVDEARTLRVLHDGHVLAGRYRDALSAVGRGWRIAMQANDARVAAAILNSLIDGVYARLGLLHRARATFDRIVKLLANDPDSWYHILAEDSMSNVNLEAGRWDEARNWAEHVIATVNARGQQGGRSIAAGAKLRLGHALIELGRPGEAAEHLINAHGHARSVGELHHEAYATALLGVGAADLGDSVTAASYLRESIRLANRIDKAEDIHLLQYLHGTLWQRLGSPRKAARAYRAAHARLLQIAAGIAPRNTLSSRMPPLRRHFLNLPFNRRIIEAAAGGTRPARHVSPSLFVSYPVDSNGSRLRADRIIARRKAVLRAVASPGSRVTRSDLAAALGVTPRTITNDLAALRRAGHQVNVAASDRRPLKVSR